MKAPQQSLKNWGDQKWTTKSGKKSSVTGERYLPKKAIDAFIYRLEMCTLCNLCITACPSDAIKMVPNFEHSVYDRSKLTKILNKPGSKIKEGIE